MANTIISKRSHERVSRFDSMTTTQRRENYEYTCTCKGYHRSTWVCRHILVVMHIDKTFDLHR